MKKKKSLLTVKNTFSEVDQDRRRFLEGTLRVSVLVLLAAFFGRLFLQKRVATPEQARCINNSICARCRIRSRCHLPQALSYQAVTGRRNQG